MKKVSLLSLLLITLLSVSVLSSCSENNDVKITPPSVILQDVGNITYNSAIANVKVVKGTDDIKYVGIKYVIESQTDTINISNYSADGVCVFDLNGLKYNSKYVVYAYATTINGETYRSSNSTFSTLNGELPKVSEVSLLERYTDKVKVSSNVEVNPDFPIIEYGYYVSQNSDMSDAEQLTVDNLSVVINNLQPRKAYYIKAFAKNEIGESMSPKLYLETKSSGGAWSYAFSTQGRFRAVAASDGVNLYFGMGTRGSTALHDWNRYNISSNDITSLNTFPGSVEAGSGENGAFCIDNTVYVTCRDNTFWAYDIDNDKWSQRSSTTGERNHHIAISVNGKGYYGLGEFYNTDFWEYDPKDNNWTLVTNSPFQWFSRHAVFSIGDDIYFEYRFLDDADFYKYNTKNKQWTKLSKFPGKATMDTFGFTIGTRGYVVVGMYEVNGSSAYTSELWEYTPIYDEWEKKADYPRSVVGVAGCSVGEKAYVGCGCTYSSPGYPSSDFYMFDPDK